MSEKRRAIRRDVAVDLPLVDVNTGRVVGDLANISYEGFMILSNRDVAQNSVFQLSLALPKRINGVDAIYFGAESLWCSPSGKSSKFWVGFHLIDISKQDFQILQLFVESV